jgi:hypothetical protein
MVCTERKRLETSAVKASVTERVPGLSPRALRNRNRTKEKPGEIIAGSFGLEEDQSFF